MYVHRFVNYINILYTFAGSINIFTEEALVLLELHLPRTGKENVKFLK